MIPKVARALISSDRHLLKRGPQQRLRPPFMLFAQKAAVTENTTLASEIGSPPGTWNLEKFGCKRKNSTLVLLMSVST
jgi:hypothetical protein